MKSHPAVVHDRVKRRAHEQHRVGHTLVEGEGSSRPPGEPCLLGDWMEQQPAEPSHRTAAVRPGWSSGRCPLLHSLPLENQDSEDRMHLGGSVR